nr:hypothetical protein [Candidatus Methylopumilus universalis]
MRFRVASAIRFFPSEVFAPVDRPPWFRHLPLLRAFAIQGLFVERE